MRPPKPLPIDRFHHAAFNKTVERGLSDEMAADPLMLGAARAEHQRLAEAAPTGIFDRCVISKHTHRVLSAALKKVDGR